MDSPDPLHCNPVMKNNPTPLHAAAEMGACFCCAFCNARGARVCLCACARVLRCVAQCTCLRVCRASVFAFVLLRSRCFALLRSVLGGVCGCCSWLVVSACLSVTLCLAALVLLSASSRSVSSTLVPVRDRCCGCRCGCRCGCFRGCGEMADRPALWRFCSCRFCCCCFCLLMLLLLLLVTVHRPSIVQATSMLCRSSCGFTTG